MQHHHPHLRKRQSQQLEPYPSSIFRIAIVDVLVYVAGIAGPVLTIPQIVSVYSTKDGSGISLITWGAYALFSAVWILYGVVHRERVLITSNTLWFLANAAVVVGALIY